MDPADRYNANIKFEPINGDNHIVMTGFGLSILEHACLSYIVFKAERSYAEGLASIIIDASAKEQIDFVYFVTTSLFKGSGLVFSPPKLNLNTLIESIWSKIDDQKLDYSDYNHGYILSREQAELLIAFSDKVTNL